MIRFGSAVVQGNVRTAFLPQRRGTMLLEGPDLQPIREDDATTGPWDLTLGPGCTGYSSAPPARS